MIFICFSFHIYFNCEQSYGRVCFEQFTERFLYITIGDKQTRLKQSKQHQQNAKNAWSVSNLGTMHDAH